MVSSCTLSTLGPMRRREAGSSAFEERPATSAGDTRMVRKLTKAEARALAQAAALPEDQIDTSDPDAPERSEEHTSELQSLMRISYAVFCLKKKKTTHVPKTTSQ